MRLREAGERRLIRMLRRGGRPTPDVFVGIGDDAAVVRGRERLLLTTDLLVEDCDFRKADHPPFLLGRKALNVNLSDIAAMGGRPLQALLGLALPGETDEKWLARFLAGFRSAGAEHGVPLVGGDFSEGPRIMIAVTVTGDGRHFVPRNGARPGDVVFVSGTLGDAAQGLKLLSRGEGGMKRGPAGHLLRAFLDPVPRLALGASLARKRLASAMIDVSDGLSVDLLHICEESRVGVELDLGRIPMSAALRRLSKNPLADALHGGEDFELLFTVRPANLARVRRLASRFELTEIGRVVRGRAVVAIDPAGRKTRLAPRGWEHFK
jgi:thiamine-monophosphate kinase